MPGSIPLRTTPAASDDSAAAASTAWVKAQGYLAATGSGAGLTGVVHTTGDETVGGAKTFTAPVVAPQVRSTNNGILLEYVDGAMYIDAASAHYFRDNAGNVRLSVLPTQLTAPALALTASTTDSALKVGPIEVQGYGSKNCWIAENAYSDGGSWRYRTTGTAEQIYFFGGTVKICQAASGPAGGVISAWTTPFSIGSDGSTNCTNGSGLQQLNASNITSGTVPTARLGAITADATNYLRGDQKWVTPPDTVGDMVQPLLNGLIPVTSGLSASLDRIYLCSGTTADYSISLPFASASTGRMIGFIMSPALTRFVTLTCGGSDTINGAASRVMWANESAILVSDGTGWIKVAGKSVPLSATLSMGAQSLATGALVKLLYTAVNDDPSTRMADVVNSRIVVRRAGTYRVQVYNAWASLTANVSRIYNSFLVNGSSYDLQTEVAGLAGGFPAITAGRDRALAASDYVEGIALHTAAGAIAVNTSILSVTEQSPW